jgi:hypothetical protein
LLSWPGSSWFLPVPLTEIGINPLLALTYQNVLDLNVACRAKRTQTYWHIRKFKCPLKKTQPSCPSSRDLNWTGKGLKSWSVCGTTEIIKIMPKQLKGFHKMSSGMFPTPLQLLVEVCYLHKGTILKEM